MERKTKRQYYLDIAEAVSKRSTCLRRHYGCVIVKNSEIIATGYNGSPRGVKNCCELGICNRIGKEHNNGDYSECCSVHAEQNAMLSAARRDMLDSEMYLYGEEETENGVWIELDFPQSCPICQRMIMNAGINQVVSRNKDGIFQVYEKEKKLIVSEGKE